MISRQELLAYCDSLLKPEEFDDYCHNGLQVEGTESIQKIASAVSCTQESIEKAIKLGAQCLFCHHGLFWYKSPQTITGPMRKKLKQALRADLNIIGYHLPLDYSEQFGNNFMAAKRLGLKNLEHFGMSNIGVRGTLDSIDIDAFQKQCESLFGQKGHLALFGKKTLQSCAIISGGAHRDFIHAIHLGVDAFITGSFDEPMWHMAKEYNCHFLAFGHDKTEQIGIQTLTQHLADKFKLETTFIDLGCPF
ncbi:MAG: hypothetical protein K940chlam8_00660 [Chlamydiae bacterium]|nr:hypothetical protein [Chlamydiota bacterium]